MQDDGGSTADRSAENRAAENRAAEGWEEVVLDEAFVQGAEQREPSARARMLAARWKREAPEPEPWRADKPPAGWFFGRRRRRWR